MNYIFGFVGASGTGKSTLLKYISDNYNVDCRELSARPFLDKSKGSYDEQMTDLIQSRIMLNNIDMTHRFIYESLTEHKNIAISRTMIDVLAYARTLKHGLGFEEQQEEFIQYINNLKNFIIFYTLPDFPLTDQNDSIRGLNEQVRQDTDLNILSILCDLNIDYITLKGSVKERIEVIDNIMLNYEINKK